MKDRDKQYIKELEHRLRQKESELERALSQKEDELAAYRRLIEVAERELDIKIVKKSGTKRSES
jgi:hypothetical protein